MKNINWKETLQEFVEGKRQKEIEANKDKKSTFIVVDNSGRVAKEDIDTFVGEVVKMQQKDDEAVERLRKIVRGAAGVADEIEINRNNPQYKKAGDGVEEFFKDLKRTR